MHTSTYSCESICFDGCTKRQGGKSNSNNKTENMCFKFIDIFHFRQRTDKLVVIAKILRYIQ